MLGLDRLDPKCVAACHMQISPGVRVPPCSSLCPHPLPACMMHWQLRCSLHKGAGEKSPLLQG